MVETATGFIEDINIWVKSQSFGQMSRLFPPSNSPSSPVPPHQLLLGFFMASESEDPHRINAPQILIRGEYQFQH